MLLEIPDAAFTESPLTASELRLEIALYLYSKKRLSFGQARKIAGLNVVEFQKALTTHGLYLNYDASDLQHDLEVAQIIR
ncbi:MAG: UPF0175 family protein [Saprospiraceae bacterium]|nr:UPF0175 family protein [Lewinellaceae bacterium]MBP6811419.1 UPF0175 family protein [Saprospiraceae bacterium]